MARKSKEINCDECTTVFTKTVTEIERTDNNFCSRKCFGKFQANKRFPLIDYPQPSIITKSCNNCGLPVNKKRAELRKFPNTFCNHSCAATHQNTHKTTGNRRSKLEVWLEEQLPILYPQYTFLFNDKTTINSELDIYIPELNLAFELNGIFHYEPIYGEDKLKQIQNNDHRKFGACQESGISLCIIDVSQFKNFKETGAHKYLDIITGIIDGSRRGI